MRKSADAAALMDISTVIVEQDLPKHERIADYMRQINDPYHYICGKFTVTASFPGSGPTIEDCLQGMMA